uniref:Uncharacterized protein n=1 Tax=Kalanchoe fedtschenkoi TaxID=63787 RepID=A0A7N0UVR8_KALFE
MKSNLLCLDLHISLVPTQYNVNVLTNHVKVVMPCREILICQASSNVKHDNGTMPLNVVTISKTTKLLLASSVPTVKPNLPAVYEEIHWMNFKSLIYLVKLSSQMALHEGSLPGSTITDNHQLEARVVDRLNKWWDPFERELQDLSNHYL